MKYQKFNVLPIINHKWILGPIFTSQESTSRLLVITALISFCFCFFSPPYIAHGDDFNEEDYVQVFVQGETHQDEKKLQSINAGAALVMDTLSGRVLFQKNGYTRRPMASTTKIMTAIVALERGNLQDTVIISKKAADTWGSDINLKAGEKLKLSELLYGLMLKSGNDAAVAIAEHIGGSVESFCQMMNEKANDLGCTNTSFKSPHGLDMAGHYTTAYELALITRYALQNSTFSKIVATSDQLITGRSLHNTNEMLGAYPGADGVKTGYTGQAGRCLVTSASRSGLRLISVVLGSPTRNARAQSSKNILDYAFDSYRLFTLLKSGKVMGQVQIIKGMATTVEVVAEGSVTMPLSQDEMETMSSRLVYPNELTAPVSAGQSIGHVEFLVEDKVIARAGLKIARDVRKKNYSDYLYDIIGWWGRLMKPAVKTDSSLFTK